MEREGSVELLWERLIPSFRMKAKRLYFFQLRKPLLSAESVSVNGGGLIRWEKCQLLFESEILRDGAVMSCDVGSKQGVLQEMNGKPRETFELRL